MLCPLPLLLPVCLLLAQPTDARDGAPPDRRGVAEYIRAGLGATTTAQLETITTTQLQTSQAGYSSVTSSIQNAGNLSELATCAASWSCYSLEATSNTGVAAVTYTAATLINTTVVLGTGDVYTYYGKIPVVSGEFTPTRTVQTLFNVSTTTSSFISTTYNPALVTETPACSFSPKDCRRLYVSYISSLGLPYNASVPKITPAPENSPHCPDYHYKPYSTMYGSTRSDLTEDCKLYGNSVELFYFPSRTEGEPEPTTPVTYKYKDGTTFTSPSIYLSFDYISATRHIPISVDSYSESCGMDGCSTAAVGGGDFIESQGTIISGQILTMAPTDVSSIVLHYDSARISGIISTVAGGLRGYGDIAQDIHLGAIISQSLTAERLRIEDLVHPPPRAYYLRPEGAPGCGSLIHEPQCGTIFEGAYRAIISLPSDVSGLQDAWRTCNPAIYGVYDPPIALTEAASVAKPTLPGGGNPPAESTAAPTRARPYTITPPLATAAKTALRDTLPSVTDGRSMHRESTLLVPSAAPSQGGSHNTVHTDVPSHGQDQNGGHTDAVNGGTEAGSQPGASNGGTEGGGQSGASTNDGNAAGGRPGASTNGGTEAGGGGAGSTARERSGGTGTQGSIGDGSATAASDRGSSSRNSAASDRTATTDRSGSGEPTDSSSSASPSDDAQRGSSTRITATLLHWKLLFGAIVLALTF